ncbi:MAG: hypothetical protein QXT42_06970 [Thermoplasmata archaeon]
MDPVLHLLLPLLLLLALRVDTRLSVMLAPIAVLPDFDAAFGLHRAAFHSFIPVVVVPVGLILYAKYRRPEWMLPALLVLFYMASHVVLDLGGVAFLWPLTTDMFYFDPQLRFNLQGGINFEWHLDMGIREYVKMGETDFISEAGFALLFLMVLAAAIYRREALSSLKRIVGVVRELFARR